MAQGFAFSRIVPAQAWIDQLLTALTSPVPEDQASGQQSQALLVNGAALLDLTQALQVWERDCVWMPSFF